MAVYYDNYYPLKKQFTELIEEYLSAATDVGYLMHDHLISK